MIRLALIIILSAIASLTFGQSSPKGNLREWEKDLFEKLNAIRENPSDFISEFNLPDLRDVESRQPLIWDSALAKMAREKAQDMAKKNYFSHTDKSGRGMNYILLKADYPLPEYFPKNRNANSVESIVADTEGPETFLELLIVDEGIPSLGHRKHLLGMDEFNARHTHIGIGLAFAEESLYKYYGCILIVHKAPK